jgi:hypothetical protein
MKDIYQILREKEQAIARVRMEVEALRVCLPLLVESNSETSIAAAPAGQSAPANRWPAASEGSSTPFKN